MTNHQEAQLLQKTTQCPLLHPFNGLLKDNLGKPDAAKDDRVAVASAGHMQIICTSLKTDNHATTSPLSFCRPDALPATQPQASKH